MKTLYIECNMGVAGDMLMSALLELVPEKEEFLRKINSLGIPGVKVSAEKTQTCGITGTHVRVLVGGEEEGEHEHEHHHHHDGDHEHEHEHEHHHHDGEHEHEHHHHEHEHHHYSLTDIEELIEKMPVSDKVKADAKAVYSLIAQAESQVHGQKTEQIHFHEVGSLDAVTDVVGNCMLMEMIGADKVVASPVHVGSGNVKCAHGILPVPAPATALLLSGIPFYSGEIKGELCTPTGASLLKYFADDFGAMPQMTVEKIGYGIGTKVFEQANCVRVMAGEEAVQYAKDEVMELTANIDDMTAEEIGFAIEILMEEGALDVYAESIIMKKSRPAVKLVCMCRPEDREKFTKLMFRHTTTIGVREYRCARTVMNRYTEIQETPWGKVSVKVSEGCGEKKAKPEFDDIAKIAREHNLSVLKIKKEIDG